MVFQYQNNILQKTILTNTDQQFTLLLATPDQSEIEDQGCLNQLDLQEQTDTDNKTSETIKLPSLSQSNDDGCDSIRRNEVESPERQSKNESCQKEKKRTQVNDIIIREHVTRVRQVRIRPGADPGFPIGGGQPSGGGGGRQHTNLSIFPKNCMKSRNLPAKGGHTPGAPPPPLNPPMKTAHSCFETQRT